MIYMDTTTQTKKCRGVCQEVKPLDRFKSNKQNKDGLQGKCIDCQKAYDAERYQQKREAILARNAAWDSKNPGHLQMRRANNRAKTAGVEGTLPLGYRDAVLRFYGDKCMNPACGATTDLTTDHVQPMSIGGANVMGNLQVLCLSCNSQKSNKKVDYRDSSNGILVDTLPGIPVIDDDYDIVA